MAVARHAILTTACLVSLTMSGMTAERVYPSGFDISISYALNKTSMSSVDTLVVTRNLVNRTAFTLHGLYFSDNLPPSFRLVYHRTTRNSSTVSATLTSDRENPILAGLVEYIWVLDTPGTSSRGLRVEPGDTVKLVEGFVCQFPGEYHLPLHTTVFFSDEVGGFFATSSAQKIVVTVATDVDDRQDLPSTYLVSSAYPNPFNGPVTIQYAGAQPGRGLTLTIFNSTGQVVHRSSATSATKAGLLVWQPAGRASSGVYFYSLRSGERSSGGKLLLLK